ncbi:MAG: hypothetical protein AAF391_13720, partial [Bacteroidota bacterium]
FFLLSVSENALSNFERRGIPLRDSFDSAFDDITYLDYLDFSEARDILKRRAIGIPVPFVSLCYCFSGGLPRDLIRVCRSIFEEKLNGKDDLESICNEIIRKDLEVKSRAVVIAAEAIHVEPEKSTFLAEMDSFIEKKLSNLKNIDEVIKIFDFSKFTSNEDQIKALSELMIEFVSYVYFSQTLVKYFDSQLGQNKLTAAIEDKSLNLLAKARQAFSVNPRLSWSRTTEFRVRNYLGSEEINF